MTNKVAFGHEVGEYGLVQRPRGPVYHGQRGDAGIHQGTGDDHIAQAEGGKKDLTETSQIDDAPLLVEALQRWQRPAHVTKLAVVVVLNNPRALFACPIE